jgi:hypothetical protein
MSGGPHPQTHDLKTWPVPYAAVRDGRKCYEVRYDDRGFKVGDYLRLREYDLATSYTGDDVTVGPITFITDLSDWVSGITAPFRVLGWRAASPPEIHSERIRRQWANSTAREITLSMAECLTEGRPVEAAIARAEEWLRGAALRDAPPQDGERLTVKDVALLYFAAEKRFQEAARGDHDGTCLGAGCSKCFMEGVQPLLDALRGRAPEGDATR